MLQSKTTPPIIYFYIGLCYLRLIHFPQIAFLRVNFLSLRTNSYIRSGRYREFFTLCVALSQENLFVLCVKISRLLCECIPLKNRCIIHAKRTKQYHQHLFIVIGILLTNSCHIQFCNINSQPLNTIL